MAGYVSSWIEAYQSRPAPCINDTILSNSSSGFAPIGNCWMWLLIGAAAVAILTKNKK